MFAKLFFLFTATSLLEIYVLIQVGGLLGVWPTIGLVVLTAFVGSSLVRSQGLQTMFNVQQRMNRGEMPGQELVEGMLLVITGVLLVTPGFVTDACGLLLLQPKLRAKLAKQVMSRVKVNVVSGGGFNQQGPSNQAPFGQGPEQNLRDGNTIEGEYKRKE